MADIVDKVTRSRMMAGIRSKDTGPEIALRRRLHGLGFRYRLHVASLPGKPDLVLPKYKAAIFVHGCFWHRHEGCRYAAMPTTRLEFWAAKFDANVARDRAARLALEALRWRVGIVWECALRRASDDVAARVAAWLVSGSAGLELSG